MEAKNHFFNALEKKILISIIKKYWTVIESTDSSFSAHHAKRVAWEKITKLYNTSSVTTKVTSVQLQMLWRNLKLRLNVESPDVNAEPSMDSTTSDPAIMEWRKHNFRPLEKEVFIGIAKRYLSIIENKTTNKSTNRAKWVAWERISRQYNANPDTVKMTSKQLRRLYMNLKSRDKEWFTKKLDSFKDEPSVDILTDAEDARDKGSLTNKANDFGADLMMNAEDGVPNSSDKIPESNMVNIEEVDLKPVLYQDPLGSPESLSRVHEGRNLSPDPSPSPPPAPKRTQLRNIAPKMPSTFAFYQRPRYTLLEKEYLDKKKRADEIHELEKELLRQRIKEAKAKAELAQSMLHQIGTDQINQDWE